MFTIIGYKPDNSDYVRGCLMNSWSSDLIVETAQNWNEAVQKAISIRTKPRDEYESEYELTVINDDGRLIIESDQQAETAEYDDGQNFLNEVREGVKQYRLAELERQQAALKEQQRLELERVKAVEEKRVAREIEERDRLLALYPLGK